ncbi:cinnamyl alcohol dehydrogenase [Coniochaeta ligniaria NRRL 30616]|uniref:alcohol dehydrogenase (NADP(+)) n=1 Tax=Coniochaeta ligniaria NRRL 30616 TaxID=1408157 RepID=A0A1J7JJB2_9PEZI|nr:cinnamyl alcohol dehydrogenase [Coniochaeta ligniaria NRRL 30616]
MGSAQDYKFEGWMGYDKSAADGKLVWTEFDPKVWEETDVDIKVSHCGICGSDLHVLRSGWGPTKYPVCVGHEIIGTVLRIGSEAASANPSLKVGSRVGVGAQSDSCRNRIPDKKCKECEIGQENYCQHGFVGTYNGTYANGSPSAGGYATHVRCPAHFVVPIPDSIPSELAAPMLCAGVTMYSPMKRNGCGPGKTVGVVGLGGLGHFGVIWAKAMGADRVVVLSRKRSKAADALAVGADAYIATEEDEDWVGANRNSLDIIISTISSNKHLGDYMSLIKARGVMIQVGLPDAGVFEIPTGPLVRGIKFEGGLVGSPGELVEMLALAAEKNVKPWVNVRPMKEANQAIVDMHEGKARYRYVLAN